MKFTSTSPVGTYSDVTLRGIEELLYIANSYYSNLIEFEGTHPVDIEKVMKKIP